MSCDCYSVHSEDLSVIYIFNIIEGLIVLKIASSVWCNFGHAYFSYHHCVSSDKIVVEFKCKTFNHLYRQTGRYKNDLFSYAETEVLLSCIATWVK